MTDRNLYLVAYFVYRRREPVTSSGCEYHLSQAHYAIRCLDAQHSSPYSVTLARRMIQVSVPLADYI
jgi:hypothetical protein